MARRRPAARVHPSGATPTIPAPDDDRTFRPTVVVRRGTSQGSGTIIASVQGETLVLTAAHVVREAGPITVELHRYNLGLERAASAQGAWPRSVRAGLAAADRAADIAIVRIRGLGALPFVARLAAPRREPADGLIVTSIGIDLGTQFTSWPTRLVNTRRLALNDGADERPFLVTARPPEHGRSGGGLFLPDGDLVGVCVGQVELSPGRRMGVFSSWRSVHRLLDDHDLDEILTRSERSRPRLESSPTASVLPAVAIVPTSDDDPAR